MTLNLTQSETKELLQNKTNTISRNGLEIVIDLDDAIECGYNITVVNPYDKVHLNEKALMDCRIENAVKHDGLF